MKRIVFLLSQKPLRREILDLLEQEFCKVDYQGIPQPFDQTDYYAPEMGTGLLRVLISCAGLVDPSGIVRDKLATVSIEDSLRTHDGGRDCNIDIGYMDTDKVVLPSLKRGPRKVYANDGVWLDMQFFYAKGQFSASPWGFEDFVRNPYHRDLLRIRELYKRELSEWRRSQSVVSD